MKKNNAYSQIVGFHGGQWIDERAALEILSIFVTEIDKRIAREQMGGGFGVVVDSLESLREWAKMEG